MTNISIHHYIKDSTKQQRYNRKFKRDKNKSWTQVYRKNHPDYSYYKKKKNEREKQIKLDDKK